MSESDKTMFKICRAINDSIVPRSADIYFLLLKIFNDYSDLSQLFCQIHGIKTDMNLQNKKTSARIELYTDIYTRT